MRPPVVALAGNPNVGKSTLFNTLTKLRQHTGNWPGKTVEVAEGICRFRGADYRVVDLPGTYSLHPHSPEEEVARAFLDGGEVDLALVVCDATCLERSLGLALQTIGRIPNTLVCVNLLDEAEGKGITLDLAALETSLGVPVVGISAGRGRGIEALMEAVELACAAPRSGAPPCPGGCAGCPLAGGGSPFAGLSDAARIRAAEAIAGRVVTTRGDPLRRDRKLDQLFLGRATGVPVMLLLLTAVLWLTIAGANLPSRLLTEWFGAAGVWLSGGLAALGVGGAVHSALVDGVWRVLSWVVAVMLPPMAIFFPLFTLLEDFGYLPRVAFVLDHAFQRARACGKQALTMCMGFGCNAAGVVGCRIIDSPRERLIAILTNSLVPCNGRFPLLTTLIAIFFAPGGAVVGAVVLAGVLLLGVWMTLLTSYGLSVTLLRGLPSSFALELPPYRTPRFGQVAVRSLLDRTLSVLGRAVAVAAPAGLVIWLCGNLTVGGISLLAHCVAALDPLGRAIGMDGVILMAFLLGFPANELVIPLMLMGYLSAGVPLEAPSLEALGALLVQNGWTWVTAACVMTFSLFHWPCSTTCLTILRETGSRKWTAVAVLLPTAIGVVLCAALAAVGRAWVG